MVSALLGLVTVALWCQTSSANVERQEKPGQVVTPEVVIPGEWMTDKTEHFLFLPLTVPKDVPINMCKVMTNGESLLVVVTEKPQEEPDTQALQKYKLVIEALKGETAHDEGLLKTKLGSWLETEDDDEVKVHIQAALESLNKVQQAKTAASHKAVSVSLGSQGNKHAASLLEVDATLRGAKHIHHHHVAKIIKESFAVEIPYPVPSESIALLRTNPTTLMVAMPLKRSSLEAKGISTGGKAFNRIPAFDNLGKWIAGPKNELLGVLSGLNLAEAIGQVGFEPLSDD